MVYVSYEQSSRAISTALLSLPSLVCDLLPRRLQLHEQLLHRLDDLGLEVGDLPRQLLRRRRGAAEHLVQRVLGVVCKGGGGRRIKALELGEE